MCIRGVLEHCARDSFEQGKLGWASANGFCRGFLAGVVLAQLLHPLESCKCFGRVRISSTRPLRQEGFHSRGDSKEKTNKQKRLIDKDHCRNQYGETRTVDFYCVQAGSWSQRSQSRETRIHLDVLYPIRWRKVYLALYSLSSSGTC